MFSITMDVWGRFHGFRRMKITDRYLRSINEDLQKRYENAPEITEDLLKQIISEDLEEDVKLVERETGDEWSLTGTIMDWLYDDMYDGDMEIVDQDIDDSSGIEIVD